MLSNIDHPWQTYEYLTRVSQIPRPERIRSDSASRPDNIWGFPSYALEEAWRDKSLKPLLQVFLEPMWADFYTPRAGHGVRAPRARGQADPLLGHAREGPGADGRAGARAAATSPS